MRQTFNRRSVLGYAVGGAAGAVLLSSTKSGQAAAMKFKADLKASSEVPPTTSSGTGSVTASYDPATKMLTWEGKFSGLTGPATAAHFHGPAEAGKNAGVLPTRRLPTSKKACCTSTSTPKPIKAARSAARL
jgi:hypothetical protein